MSPSPEELLTRLREICMVFPEMSERVSHGAPTFFVREKKVVLAARVDGHHDTGFPQIWCPAPDGAQASLLESDGERFFAPPYVGGRGWIGLRLDTDLDWDEITAIAEDAYRHVAPKSLIKQLDP